MSNPANDTNFEQMDDAYTTCMEHYDDSERCDPSNQDGYNSGELTLIIFWIILIVFIMHNVFKK